MLSDQEKLAAKAFGAIAQGKVKRRTWLINEDWKIEEAYEKVSPSKHDGELCEYYLLK